MTPDAVIARDRRVAEFRGMLIAALRSRDPEVLRALAEAEHAAHSQEAVEADRRRA